MLGEDEVMLDEHLEIAGISGSTHPPMSIHEISLVLNIAIDVHIFGTVGRDMLHFLVELE